MLMLKQFVYRYVVAAIAEMRRLSRLLSGSRRSCDSRHMYLVVNQAIGCKRKRRQLDSCRKTPRISDVVRLSYLFPRTFAKPVYEMSSCVVSVQPEIISQIDDPAVRAYLMRVHELT